MRNLTRTAAVATAGVALVASIAACSSSSSGGSSASSDKKPVATIASLKDGISTSVALDSGFVSALKSLKVTPSPYGTATISSAGVASFPITGGHVTVYKKGAVTPYVVGEIDHNGSGLNLAAGGTKVTLDNFVIDPGTAAHLSGDVLVNGKSAVKGARLFNLDGRTLKPITIDSAGVAKLTGTLVKLSPDAATLLNQTFKVDAFKGGFLIGVATILANSK